MGSVRIAVLGKIWNESVDKYSLGQSSSVSIGVRFPEKIVSEIQTKEMYARIVLSEKKKINEVRRTFLLF